MTVPYICRNGCVVHSTPDQTRVGHFCTRMARIAGKHPWLYAYPPDKDAA